MKAAGRVLFPAHVPGVNIEVKNHQKRFHEEDVLGNNILPDDVTTNKLRKRQDETEPTKTTRFRMHLEGFTAAD